MRVPGWVDVGKIYRPNARPVSSYQIWIRTAQVICVSPWQPFHLLRMAQRGRSRRTRYQAFSRIFLPFSPVHTEFYALSMQIPNQFLPFVPSCQDFPQFCSPSPCSLSRPPVNSRFKLLSPHTRFLNGTASALITARARYRLRSTVQRPRNTWKNVVPHSQTDRETEKR